MKKKEKKQAKKAIGTVKDKNAKNKASEKSDNSTVKKIPTKVPTMKNAPINSKSKVMELAPKKGGKKIESKSVTKAPKISAKNIGKKVTGAKTLKMPVEVAVAVTKTKVADSKKKGVPSKGAVSNKKASPAVKGKLASLAVKTIAKPIVKVAQKVISKAAAPKSGVKKAEPALIIKAKAPMAKPGETKGNLAKKNPAKPMGSKPKLSIKQSVVIPVPSKNVSMPKNGELAKSVPSLKTAVISEEKIITKGKSKVEFVTKVKEKGKKIGNANNDAVVLENVTLEAPVKKTVLHKLEIKKNSPAKEGKGKTPASPPRELWRPDYSNSSPSIDKYTFVNINKPEPIKIESGINTGKLVKFETKKADAKKSALKAELMNKCLEVLNKSVAISKKEMDDAQESANEEKGSTEEKFDSFRESMQTARDMFARQYSEGVNSVSLVNRINPNMEQNVVILGSVVRTDLMNYFVSVSVGEILIGKEKFIAISTQTPLCQAIFGKKKGDTFKLMNKTYTIIEVF